jgi:hypothetical protein
MCRSVRGRETLQAFAAKDSRRTAMSTPSPELIELLRSHTSAPRPRRARPRPHLTTNRYLQGKTDALVIDGITPPTKFPSRRTKARPRLPHEQSIR